MWHRFLQNQSFALLTYATVGILFLTFVASYMLRPPAPATESSAGTKQATGSPDIELAHQVETSQSGPREKARQELSEVLSQAGELLQSVQQHVVELASRLDEIQDGAEGKRVAGSAENFQRMLALIRYVPTKRELLDSLADQYRRFVADEVKATKESEWNSIRSAAESLQENLEAEDRELSDANTAVSAILEVCQGLPQADKTLRQSIAAARAAEKLEFAEKLKQEQDAAESERQKAVRDAERKKQNAVASLDNAKARLEETKLRAQESQTNITNMKRQANQDFELEKTKLELEFQRDLPEIRRYLGPLLASGKKQPHSPGYQVHTETLGPMSLTALRRAGSLLASEKGLSNLGLAMTYGNDRDTSGFPQYIGGMLRDEHRSYLQPAQRLLLKYQYLLVEKGMLAP